MFVMKRMLEIAKSEWAIASAIMFLAVLWSLAFEYVFDTAAPGIN
jgi:hypothetical protein